MQTKYAHSHIRLTNFDQEDNENVCPLCFCLSVLLFFKDYLSDSVERLLAVIIWCHLLGPNPTREIVSCAAQPLKNSSVCVCVSLLSVSSLQLSFPL